MLRPFLKALFCLLISCAALTAVSGAQAATKTICASGCDYTSITAAFGDTPSDGDVYQVQGGGGSPYNPSAETFDLNFPSVSSTLTCTGGATIGQSNPLGSNLIYLSTSSTIQGCNLSNVQLFTASLGTEPARGVRIVDNAFSTTATSTIAFSYGAQDFAILNNTNINHFSTGATTTNGLIQNNTFYGRVVSTYSNGIFGLNASSSRIQILGNTFANRSASGGIATRLVALDGWNITFATNTISYPVEFSSDTMVTSLFNYASGTNYISGNFIDTPSSTASCNGIRMTGATTGPWSTTTTIAHNTIRQRGNCTNGVPIYVASTGNRSDILIEIRAAYNLLYNAASTTAVRSAIEYSLSSNNYFVESNDWNGAYGFDPVVKRVIGVTATNISGANSRTAYPFLKVLDTDQTNDLETAAFSNYLDADGTRDIGATSGVRRSTVTLDDNGTVDYSTVDATSTSYINQFIRSGDAVTLAAGSYAGFSVSSTYATSSISITGAGNSTIITAASGEDGVRLSSVSTSTLSDVRVTGASTGSRTYDITKLLYSHGGTDYDDGVTGEEIDPNSMLIIRGAGCDVAITTGDGYDVTSLTSAGTVSFNVALVDVGGAKITALVPDSVYGSGAALDADCGITTDVFIEDVFTPSAGVYTYNSATIASAGATLLGSVTTPPVLDDDLPLYAGVRLANASGWTISGVTSTANAVGVLFTGTTASSTVSDSVLQSSSYYDLMSTASATNTIDNVTFTRTSSSVELPRGGFLVNYKARVRTVSTGGSAISGAYATSTSSIPNVTALGATDGSGYTSYLSLPAHTITPASSALTNGVYNPYTFVAAATGRTPSSTVVTLSSRNQLVTLVLSSSGTPTPPTAASSTSLTTTGATFIWTDHSDDEDSFTVDYRRPLFGQAYPGTVSSVTGATSTAITGLTPGETYEFRVAAVNFNGTSAYATSVQFALPPAAAGAPSLSALSRTSLSVTLDTNGNATSVQYAIYSSTLNAYLDAAGVATTTSVWQASSTWATPIVSNLNCGTNYSFVAVARNVFGTEAATSSASTVTTSACATTVTSGGGAVGGGGGGGGIQTFFNTPTTPVTTHPVSAPVSDPAVSQPTPAPTPTPVAPAPTLTPAERLTNFLEQGTDPVSRALGAGERAAVLRDAQETMRRTDIPVDDLERIARGEIPRTRNLAYERSMAPRALATFRTLFGHAPNFQNQTENLAWNTLMYRLRFPRNLTDERQGIADFRRVFRTTPQSPFQWSVVRVMGYLLP
jgi:hypothetical protein